MNILRLNEYEQIGAVDRRCRIYALTVLLAIILYLALSDKVYGQDIYEVTAYCSCEKCCGEWADGLTFTGQPAHWGTIAVDGNVIALGSGVEIEGFPNMIFHAEDIGSAIKGNRIDIWFPSHQEALEFGRQWRFVKVFTDPCKEH